MATFEWKCFSQINDLMTCHLGERFTPELTAELIANRNQFEYTDDSSAIQPFLISDDQDVEQFYGQLGILFRDTYEHVTMFHCCRPVETSPYYENGILVLDEREFANRFNDIVKANSRFANVTDAHFETAFAQMQSSAKRHGYTYYCLDDRYTISYCSHYLDNGPEYWQALARIVDEEAGTGDEIFEHLKTIGHPTVFQLTVPTTKLNDKYMSVLATALATTWGYNIAHQQNDPCKIDFCIADNESVRPEMIVTHYSPPT